MLRTHLLTLAFASHVFASSLENFADDVVGYDPGAGYALAYTYLPAVLGEPSRLNPFADPTDPFNPPYGTNQILSIGLGGSVTIRFHTPILNHPNNLHGLDFIIYGNSGFIITNEFDGMNHQWIGIPATDGSLFGQNPGGTVVSVSRDGIDFHLLDPAQARVVDGFFPTDGSGRFDLPVDPIVEPEDFAGLTLDQIRSLYHGSAGGTAFDISWALDAGGQRIFLPEINFIRVDVLSGKAEIDGFSAVARVPRRGQRPR